MNPLLSCGGTCRLRRPRASLGVILVLTMCSAAAQTITAHYRVPGAPTLRSIASNSIGLVAVGDSGYVLSSPDRRTWTASYVGGAPSTGSGAHALTGVAYGNGRYVAVDDGGHIWSSTDGRNWISPDRPTSRRLNGVAYENRFIAVGENGAIVSSRDGITWQLDPSPTQQSLRSVAAGGMNQSWFSIVGTGGTWVHDANGRWEIASSGTTADLNTVVTDFYAYFVSFGGISYWEPRGVLAGGAAGAVRTLSRTSYRVHVDFESRVSASPTTARVLCVLAGRPRTVPRWHPSYPNSTTTYATQHVLLDEQGKVFWAAERPPGEQAIREWKTVGTINGVVHGGLWSPAEDRFYLVGDASAIYTVEPPATPVLPVAPPPVVVTPPPVVPPTPPPVVPEPGGFANASVRGFVSAAQGPLIAGITIPGTTERLVLIRGMGPGLERFGVTNALARPRLTVYRGAETFESAADLETDPRASVLRAYSVQAGAFPPTERDSALFARLAPGTWTVTLTSADGGSGTALIETYVLP